MQVHLQIGSNFIVDFNISYKINITEIVYMYVNNTHTTPNTLLK